MIGIIFRGDYKAILYKVRKAKEDILDLGDNTEFTLLLFDLLSCPYLEIRFKKQLLNLYKNNIGNIDNVVNYISSNKWFIDWGKSSFREILDKKIGLEVY